MKGAEEIKRLDMVKLLNLWYGMDFEKVGNGNSYRSHSVFTCERYPSFFVRCVDGHWLFKDFSSGYGGSLIDFVQIKEKLESVSQALHYITGQLEGPAHLPKPWQCARPRAAARSYDLEKIYNIIEKNAIFPSTVYLNRRGIGGDLIDYLVKDKLLLNNRPGQGQASYCCFVVRNSEAKLCCLDNHEIGGSRKFVLGNKHPFTLDYKMLCADRATTLFVTEGIIDYLSIKELEGKGIAGLALLGNRADIKPTLVRGVQTIISALDNDSGGKEGTKRLHKLYPDKQIIIYPLKGANDPNQLLLRRY
jgi:DNA primase